MIRLAKRGLLGSFFLLSAAPTEEPQPPLLETWESDKYTIQAQDWITPAGTTHTMLLVPAGLFWSGLDKIHWVAMASQLDSTGAFWIDKYEVSSRLYNEFRQATGHRAPRFSTYWGGPEIFLQDDLPVIGVTRQDAIDYCTWAGLRLPRILEWRKSARGTDGRLYPWGNEKPRPGLANYGKYDEGGFGSFDPDSTDGYLYTAPVDAMPDGASPYGALNMAGNVAELVMEVSSTRRGRAARALGGNWHTPKVLLELGRRGSMPLLREGHALIDFRCREGHANIGFRCCRDEENTSIERKNWGQIKRQGK